MNGDPQKRKVLYEALTKDGYALGTLDEFSTKMDSPDKAKALHDGITKDGYDVGDFDTFNGKVGASFQEAQSSSTTPSGAVGGLTTQATPMDGLAPVISQPSIPSEPDIFNNAAVQKLNEGFRGLDAEYPPANPPVKFKYDKPRIFKDGEGQQVVMPDGTMKDAREHRLEEDLKERGGFVSQQYTPEREASMRAANIWTAADELRKQQTPLIAQSNLLRQRREDLGKQTEDLGFDRISNEMEGIRMQIGELEKAQQSGQQINPAQYNGLVQAYNNNLQTIKPILEEEADITAAFQYIQDKHQASEKAFALDPTTKEQKGRQGIADEQFAQAEKDVKEGNYFTPAVLDQFIIKPASATVTRGLLGSAAALARVADLPNKALGIGGDYTAMDEAADNLNAAAEELAPSPKGIGTPLLDKDWNVNTTNLLPKVIQAVTYMGMMGTAGAARGTAGMVGAAYATTESDYYKEAIARGMKPDEATAFSMRSAATTALLERVSPGPLMGGKSVKDVLMSRVMRSLKEGRNWKDAISEGTKYVLKEALPEGAQEMTQQAGDDLNRSIANAALGDDVLDGPSSLQQYAEAGLLGATVGTLGAVGAKAASRPLHMQTLDWAVRNREKVEKAISESGREDAPELLKNLQVLSGIYDGNGLKEMPPEQSAKVASIIQQKNEVDKAIKVAPMDAALEAAIGDPRKKASVELTTQMIESMGVPKTKAKAALVGTGMEEAPEGTKVVTNADGSVTLEKKPETPTKSVGEKKKAETVTAEVFTESTIARRTIEDLGTRDLRKVANALYVGPKKNESWPKASYLEVLSKEDPEDVAQAIGELSDDGAYKVFIRSEGEHNYDVEPELYGEYDTIEEAKAAVDDLDGGGTVHERRPDDDAMAYIESIDENEEPVEHNYTGSMTAHATKVRDVLEETQSRFGGKYSSKTVRSENSEGRPVDVSVKLRIADHTGNPRNDDGGPVLSVIIAKNDPTGRGQKPGHANSIYIDDDLDPNEVEEMINEALDEIAGRWADRQGEEVEENPTSDGQTDNTEEGASTTPNDGGATEVPEGIQPEVAPDAGVAPEPVVKPVSQRQKKRERKAEQEKVLKDANDVGAFDMGASGLAIRYLANGGKVNTQSLISELGLRDSKGKLKQEAFRGKVWAHDNKSKSIEAVADKIAEENEGIDAAEVRTELISALQDMRGRNYAIDALREYIPKSFDEKEREYMAQQAEDADVAEIVDALHDVPPDEVDAALGDAANEWALYTPEQKQAIFDELDAEEASYIEAGPVPREAGNTVPRGQDGQEEILAAEAKRARAERDRFVADWNDRGQGLFAPEEGQAQQTIDGGFDNSQENFDAKVEPLNERVRQADKALSDYVNAGASRAQAAAQQTSIDQPPAAIKETAPKVEKAKEQLKSDEKTFYKREAQPQVEKPTILSEQKSKDGKQHSIIYAIPGLEEYNTVAIKDGGNWNVALMDGNDMLWVTTRGDGTANLAISHAAEVIRGAGKEKLDALIQKFDSSASRATPEPATPTEPKPAEETRAQKAARNAAAIRAKKRKLDPGTLHDATEVIATKLFNGALEVVAKAVEAGATVAEQIELAIRYLRDSDAWKSLRADDKKQIRQDTEDAIKANARFDKWVDFGAREFAKQKGKLDYLAFKKAFIKNYSSVSNTVSDIDLVEVYSEAQNAYDATVKDTEQTKRTVEGVTGVSDKRPTITLTERQFYTQKIRDIADGAKFGFDRGMFSGMRKGRKEGMQEQKREDAIAEKERIASRKEEQKTFVERINEVMEPLKSKLTPSQVKGIVNKAAKVSTPAQVRKFTDYVEKVFNDAEYADKVSQANKTAKVIAKEAKKNASEKRDANLNSVARQFATLDIDQTDIDEYNGIASRLLSTLETPKVDRKLQGPGNVKNIDFAISNKEVSDYIEKQQAVEQSQAEQDIIEEFEQIRLDLGLDAASLTVKGMADIIAAMKGDEQAEQRLSDQMADEGRRAIMKEAAAAKLSQLNEYVATLKAPLTKDQKTIHDDLNKIDIDLLTAKDVAWLITGVNSITTNDGWGGMRDFAAKGRAHEFWGEWAGKNLGRPGSNFATFTDQVAMVANKIARGVRAAAKFRKGTGLEGTQNAISNAARLTQEKQARRNWVAQNNDYKDTRLNRYKMGVFGYLTSHFDGTPEEIQAEFDKKVRNLRDSVGRIKDKDKAYDHVHDKAKEYEQAVNEVLGDVTNMEGLKLPHPLREMVENERAEFAKQQASGEESALLDYNKINEQQNGYLPTGHVGVNATFTPRDAKNEFDRSKYGKRLNTEESGSKQQKTNSLPQNSIIDLDLFKVADESFNESAADNEGARHVAVMREVMQDPRAITAFGADTHAMLKNMMVDIVNSEENKKSILSAGKLFDKAVRVAVRKGQRIALAGILQYPKQATVAFSTAMALGKDVGLYFSSLKDVIAAHKGEDNWQRNLMKGEQVWERAATLGGLEKVGDPISSEAILTGSESAIAELAKQFYDKSGKVAAITMKPLAKSDAFQAQAAWLAFYKSELKKKGVDLNDPAWHEQKDEEAAAFANQAVEHLQNANTSMSMPAIYRDRGGLKQIMHLAWAYSSFALNMKKRMARDIQALRLGSKEDKKFARASIAGSVIETFMYSAMAHGIAAGSKAIIISLINAVWPPNDDDEEKRKKAEMDAKKRHPLAQIALRTAFDVTLGGQPSMLESVEKGKIINPIYAALTTGDQRPLYYVNDDTNLGVFGSVAENFVNLADAGNVAITGEAKKATKGGMVFDEQWQVDDRAEEGVSRKNDPRYEMAPVSTEARQMAATIALLSLIELGIFSDQNLTRTPGRELRKRMDKELDEMMKATDAVLISKGKRGGSNTTEGSIPSVPVPPSR